MHYIAILLSSLLLCGCTIFTAEHKPAVTVYSKDGGLSTSSPSGSSAVTVQQGGTNGNSSAVSASQYLSGTGYNIQAGAFSLVDNAAALTDQLENNGLDPYYFKENNFYKVRFGSFSSKDAATAEAEKLKSRGVITEYYIVTPQETSAVKSVSQSGGGGGSNYLRDQLVKTAKGYIGVPYKWGGNTRAGIDCSGLTQAVYNYNGLSIPRNSAVQAQKGKAVNKNNLQKGDLVFFATSGGKRVSHVGIYIGNGEFIHAPSKGKLVRTEKLSNSYWTRVYVGGRSYI